MNLGIKALRHAYVHKALAPRALIAELLEAITTDSHSCWIHVVDKDWLEPWLSRLEKCSPDDLPLYGIPFAIKDNIDLAGIPTTAGCPAYRYTPETHAFVVEKLLEAGAIPLGKTNMDQFATGLVGTRSPYGACKNAFDPHTISGGSSSGSAVAVALGQVSFALGTDTAGSGRVPAAFNNIVGLKPGRGLLSTRGVVPACRSLDAVTVFALGAGDAEQVFKVAAIYDQQDSYARPLQPPALGPACIPTAGFRFAVPRREQLRFFGDDQARHCFAEAVSRMTELGGEAVTVDFSPFFEAARLLYEGPWVAERYAAVGDFVSRHPHQIDSTVRQIIRGGADVDAVSAFRATYRLAGLKRKAEALWTQADFALTPTTGTIYRIDEIDAEPVHLNTNLGYYTNFMNLLDLSAVAVPAGSRRTGDKAGLPFGITLFGPAGCDLPLLSMAERFCGTIQTGRPGKAVAEHLVQRVSGGESQIVRVAVCGAHMHGLPLNWQLASRRGRLLEVSETAPEYRFYVLPGGPPERPGLVRVNKGGGSIHVEIWSLPLSEFGSFVAGIPSPLGIGRVRLRDGSEVAGFVCESAAVAGTRDITALKSWHNYLSCCAAKEANQQREIG